MKASLEENPATVETLRTADVARAIDTLVLAFATDPVVRWVWPAARQYLQAMPKLALAMGGNAFSHDGALACGQGSGVALFLPPGVAPNEDLIAELVLKTVHASLQPAMFSLFEQMAGFHPDEPHGYLPLIGVDPLRQGCGLGGALLTRIVEECDERRVPAYLESTNPRNVPLYRRHGFEVVGTIQAGSSPMMIPMIRPARK